MLHSKEFLYEGTILECYNLFFVDFGIFDGCKEKDAKYRKIQIFEHDSGLLRNLKNLENLEKPGKFDI